MKIGPFAQIELPQHVDDALDSLLLGNVGVSDSFGNGNEDTEGVQEVVSELLTRAHDRYFRGFYADGLDNYARALHLDGRQIEAWTGQIRILVDVGRYDAAVYWAEKGLDRFPDSTLLRCARAFALAYGSKIEKAKQAINVPLDEDDSSLAWLFRGEVFLKIKINVIQKLFTPYKGIGRMGAFFCFFKALSTDQDDAFLNQRIGFAYMIAGDTNRACEHLSSSLRAVSDNPLTLYGLAQCHRMNKNYDNAVCYAKKAIAGNPNLDGAFGLLQWLHSPARKYWNLFARPKGKE
jgi:tetratricopeptide (TPR) repeat protein